MMDDAFNKHLKQDNSRYVFANLGLMMSNLSSEKLSFLLISEYQCIKKKK
jgi:hypothetical protein